MFAVPFGTMDKIIEGHPGPDVADLVRELNWSHCEVSYFAKKTYGHKYYVATSIGFEEKSYPFIRKMK